MQRERLFVATREAAHHEVVAGLLQEHAGGVLGHTRAQNLADRKHVDQLHRNRHQAVLSVAKRPLHEALVNQLVKGTSDKACIVLCPSPQVVDERLEQRARMGPGVLRNELFDRPLQNLSTMHTLERSGSSFGRGPESLRAAASKLFNRSLT